MTKEELSNLTTKELLALLKQNNIPQFHSGHQVSKDEAIKALTTTEPYDIFGDGFFIVNQDKLTAPAPSAGDLFGSPIQPPKPASIPTHAPQPAAGTLESMIAQMVAAPVASSIKSEIDGKLTEIEQKLKKIAEENKPIIKIYNINNVGNVSLPKGINEHKKLKNCLELMALDINVYLCGPAGSGKTTLSEQIAMILFPDSVEERNGNLTSNKFASVSCSDDLTAGDIYGRLTPTLKDGVQVIEFKKSPFLEIYENGGVFLFDEIDASAPEVLINVNKALAQSSIDIPSYGKAYKHKDCHLMAAGNTTGSGATNEYSARSKLDGATLNRFEFIHLDYDINLEDKIIDAYLFEKASIVKTARDKIRAAIKSTGQTGLFFSLRQCINYSKMLKAGIIKDPDDIATRFANAINDEGTRKRFLSAI